MNIFKKNKQTSPTTITQLVDREGKGKAGGATNSESSAPTKEKIHINLMSLLLEKNMLVPGSDLSLEMQDDYRRVKRPLVSNAVGRNKSLVEKGNLILVTSAVPGEGKSYTSINLALSMAAELDTTVLLVDCDVAKQGVSRTLGLEGYKGLADVLENDDLDISDVMLHTDIPKLRVVTAGTHNEYVAEFLASQRMQSLFDELSERYSDRIIVCDGPPLLPTPQTQILAGLVGQIVFVIETGKTPQSFVEEALSLLPEEQAVGIILNKCEGLTKGNTYYGYGYYADEEDYK